MRVTVKRDRATLTADLPQSVCRSTDPTAMIARRGGKVLRAPLTMRECRLQGALRLPERGRWFIYLEVNRDGRAAESWLPVMAGAGSRDVREVDRYVYAPPERAGRGLKLIGGAVLYGGMLALLYVTFVLIRASRRQRAIHPPTAAPLWGSARSSDEPAQL